MRTLPFLSVAIIFCLVATAICATTEEYLTVEHDLRSFGYEVTRYDGTCSINASRGIVDLVAVNNSIAYILPLTSIVNELYNTDERDRTFINRQLQLNNSFDCTVAPQSTTVRSHFLVAMGRTNISLTALQASWERLHEELVCSGRMMYIDWDQS